MNTQLIYAADIHNAVIAGDINRVQNILASDSSSASLKDERGCTPLQLAVERGFSEIVAELLLNTRCIYAEAFIDARTTAGSSAIASGTIEKAYDMFFELLKKYPENANVNFACGMTCLSLKKYSHAEMAFMRALQANPLSARIRAELAGVFTAMGYYEIARQYYQEALAARPSTIAAERIRFYLEQMQISEKRFRIMGRVDIGYIYDNNVNIGPESSVINIVPLVISSQRITSLTVSERSRPLDTSGAFASGTCTAGYDIGVRGGWVLSADGAFYRDYLKDAKNLETLYLHTGTGLRHTSMRDMISLPLYISHIERDDNTLVDVVGTSAEWLYNLERSGSLQLQTACIFENRNYKELDVRDGYYVELNGTLIRNYRGIIKTLWGGVSLFHDHTDADIYKYSGAALKSGMSLALPL